MSIIMTARKNGEKAIKVIEKVMRNAKSSD